jgi:hypothetical protein
MALRLKSRVEGDIDRIGVGTKSIVSSHVHTGLRLEPKADTIIGY